MQKSFFIVIFLYTAFATASDAEQQLEQWRDAFKKEHNTPYLISMGCNRGRDCIDYFSNGEDGYTLYFVLHENLSSPDAQARHIEAKTFICHLSTPLSIKEPDDFMIHKMMGDGTVKIFGTFKQYDGQDLLIFFHKVYDILKRQRTRETQRCDEFPRIAHVQDTMGIPAPLLEEIALY